MFCRYGCICTLDQFWISLSFLRSELKATACEEHMEPPSYLALFGRVHAYFAPLPILICTTDYLIANFSRPVESLPS
jgi:hypothetical protein